MRKNFYSRLFLFAFLLVLIPVLVFSDKVLAFGKPNWAGSGNPGFSNQNHPTGLQSSRPTMHMNADNSSTASSGGEDTPPFHRLGGTFNPKSSHVQAFTQQKLHGNKLQSCQSVEKALKNRSTHLVTLVTNMEKVFTSIAEGIEQYYLTKAVPSGATLSNYDALVADITTKQNALTPLVTAAQNDVTNFSCNGNNPGADMTQYRTDMQAVVQGLKAYKTSIRNLIVAVRTLHVTQPTGTVTPTESVTQMPTETVTVTSEPTNTVTPSVTP